MAFVRFKRFILYSVTFTGGCVTFWPKNTTMKFWQKNEEKFSDSEDLPSYIYLPESTGNDFDESVVSSWNFARKKNLPTYWNLFQLCKSNNIKVRHKAIESLSESSLEKWQYFAISQACDIDTSIGLARSLNANPQFFLPPPFRDLHEGNLQNELYLILSMLPISNIDKCTKKLVKQVKASKFLLKHGYHWTLEVGDPLIIYHSQQTKKAVLSYDKLCLEAILACSSNSSHRSIMMKNGILKTMLKLWRTHKKDVYMHSLIAQILSNFAMEETFRKDISLTGWIGILSEWTRSPFINVNLPAAKTLANLDNDDLSHPLYDDGVFVLNPLCRLSKKDIFADVIFVHGLLGATFWTWRQCDTQNLPSKSVTENSESSDVPIISKGYSTCWPKDWLAADIPSLRIISVDYKTCLSSWSPCCFEGKEKDGINKRARDITTKLLLSNVGEKPIIWITHSMGGLIVKKILIEALQSKDEKIHALAKKTAGLVFYSVPHKGSELANRIEAAAFILQLSNDITELCKDSQNLLILHNEFKDFVSKCNIPVLSFGESKKSSWSLGFSLLVHKDSADPGFGQFYTLPVDHLSTCKPQSSNSFDYVKVLKFLQNIMFEISTSQTSEMNSSETIFEISQLLCLIP